MSHPLRYRDELDAYLFERASWLAIGVLIATGLIVLLIVRP